FTQWLTFASTSEVQTPIKQVRIIGPGAAIPNLARAMKGRVPVPVAEPGDRPSSLPTATFDPTWCALQCSFKLPDLLPAEIRRRLRFERGAALRVVCGPWIASALLTLTAMLWKLGGGIMPALAAQQFALQRVEAQLAEHHFCESESARVRSMQCDIQDFSAAVPRWTGTFKELGRILPARIVVRQLEARSDAQGIELFVGGRVDPGDGQPEFDALIRDSLLALQGSCF